MRAFFLLTVSTAKAQILSCGLIKNRFVKKYLSIFIIRKMKVTVKRTTGKGFCDSKLYFFTVFLTSSSN